MGLSSFAGHALLNDFKGENSDQQDYLPSLRMAAGHMSGVFREVDQEDKEGEESQKASVSFKNRGFPIDRGTECINQGRKSIQSK